jgi:type I restriction enzyme M protein
VITPIQPMTYFKTLNRHGAAASPSEKDPMSTQATERADLHRTIWKAADKLRGQVDGWDFKAYILGMLFYRFLSESLVEFIDAEQQEAGDDWEGYSSLARDEAEGERGYYTHAKGYYILPEDLFQNVRARAAKDENLNMTLKRALDNITASAVGTESEDDFRGLFDDLDPNSARLGNAVADRNRRLRALLDAIGDLDLSHNGNTIDAFGDAYEYLMTMYASQAGRSGGEFFTPQEVSELVARLTVVGKTEINKVYDPAVGSGSLLLKFDKVLGHGNVRQGYFGQEINTTTYNLCRINMFLHGIPYEKFDIRCGDTLTSPLHGDDEPFQAIVSNPPYSIEWEGDSNAALIDDERFSPAGVLAPRTKADLAFTMHMLSWLAEDGTAAIVEFPGVLYRGGAEQKIRKYLIDNNFVDAVIHLPSNIFFGTSIETAILVLKKSKADSKVLFIDARAQFVKSGNKNQVAATNQQTILDAFTARTDVPHFATLVDNDIIGDAKNNYNLSAPSYVVAADTSEAVDAAELNSRIARIVTEQGPLRDRVDAIVAEIEAGK